MPQLEHIDAIERRLWSAADTLRANSNYAGNEYFLPVMGLVFLRHAFSRYLVVRDEVVAGLPTRRGRKRAPTPQDFSRKGAMLLRPEARFDHLVALPGGADRAKAIVEAMESIEADYESLRGALPKDARFLELVSGYLWDVVAESRACFEGGAGRGGMRRGRRAGRGRTRERTRTATQGIRHAVARLRHGGRQPGAGMHHPALGGGMLRQDESHIESVTGEDLLSRVSALRTRANAGPDGHDAPRA